MELEWRGASRRPATAGSLSLAAFREVQQQVAVLIRAQRQQPDRPPLHISAIILRILDRLLVGLGMTNRADSAPLSPVSAKVQRILDSSDAATVPVAQLARRVGYQRDYLNRLLKAQTGMTLGQMRAGNVLTRAQRLLRGQTPVGRVAGDLGFSDANYFARWFRKQTGHSPSQWRRLALMG
jgi:AraC family L-rhamnose operon transcriptional activator RhaR